METTDELVVRLTEMTQTGTRDQLLARGLARGMIWDEGELPSDGPQFSESLTNDLLNHGFSVLGCALRLRAIVPSHPILDSGFRTAAESIEAAVRRGMRDEDRGFHLTVAAAAFHLGHYAARSFSLLAEDRTELNLSSVELLLVVLMQRRLNELEGLCLNWLWDEANTDEGIAGLLQADDNNFTTADAARVVVSRRFHQAIAVFEFALRTGDATHVDSALEILDACVEAADHMRHVPLWWSSVLARHLIDDLWDRSLHTRLPEGPDDGSRWPELRSNFIELATQRDIAEIDLWPSQIAAATRVVDETDSLVVALPTSSGKTRIAELCILKCLAGGRRVVYVTPLRALSAQVEVTLGRTFRRLGFSVTSVYGASGLGACDVDTMASANIVVATPEKLDFAIRQSPDVIDDVGLIVLDEGHMIGLNEREIRYEVLVQRLLRREDADTRRIVCLSAIFTEGDPFDAFTQWIRGDREGDAIRSKWRPTRQRPATLEWQSTAARLEYRVQGETVFVPRFIESSAASGRRRNDFPQDRSELMVGTIQRFIEDGHSVLVYCPQRSSVESAANAYLKAVRQGYAASLLPEELESEISAALRIGAEWLGDDHVAVKALRFGIAVHHGQLPRPFLGEIERLLRRRVLRAAVSSPTLAQGVDLSFSVLIFNSLWRGGDLIPPKEFANVVGRVGRAYVDLDGIYVLPVHEANAFKRRQRLREFHDLIRNAGKRQLESGLFLLIRVCLNILSSRLNVDREALADYVLNQQHAIDSFSESDDEASGVMAIVLAELDAGIFALIENLDCNVSDVASLLDEALTGSYWAKRLAVRPLQEQEAQAAVLRGRAGHIWGRTNHGQRSKFFAASIGTEAGLNIVEQSATLQVLLTQCIDAIRDSDPSMLGSGCADLAEILFEIYPFQVDDCPKDWRAILSAWVGGLPLTSVTDATGIAFVQDALVFRLVWAIEAVRIVLAPDDEDPSVNETFVAMCMTYGVPSIAAARLMESGLESRLLAVRLWSELNLTFTTRDDLLEWLTSYRDSDPIEFTDDERAIWNKFLVANESTHGAWHRQQEQYDFANSEEWEIESGEPVRVISDADGRGDVYSSDFEWFGEVASGLPTNSSLVGQLLSNGEIQTRRFGPLTLPAWMAELFDNYSDS